jgi:hypothetical protein
MLRQANHNDMPCMPILRFCVLSRLLSPGAEDGSLSLSHTCESKWVCSGKDEAQGRNHAFSRVFVCVSECGAIHQSPLLHSERDDAVPCDLCRIYLHVDIIADGSTATIQSV